MPMLCVAVVWSGGDGWSSPARVVGLRLYKETGPCGGYDAVGCRNFEKVVQRASGTGLFGFAVDDVHWWR